MTEAKAQLGTHIGIGIVAGRQPRTACDPSVIEALRASGASWLQIVFQAVIPSSTTALLSWTFIRLEITFTTAVAMGAAAGAGGIGFSLFMASGYCFNIREVGFLTCLILAAAVLLELAATRLKRRMRL